MTAAGETPSSRPDPQRQDEARQGGKSSDAADPRERGDMAGTEGRTGPESGARPERSRGGRMGTGGTDREPGRGDKRP